MIAESLFDGCCYAAAGGGKCAFARSGGRIATAQRVTTQHDRGTATIPQAGILTGLRVATALMMTPGSTKVESRADGGYLMSGSRWTMATAIEMRRLRPLIGEADPR